MQKIVKFSGHRPETVYNERKQASAVADEPAPRAESRQTAKFKKRSRDHNHAHAGGDTSSFW